MMTAATQRFLPEASAVLSESKPNFEAIYEEHFGFVWRSLRRLGLSPSSAEDAAQDTFIVFHRKLDSLRGHASAKSFLFGIARRVASDYRRAGRRVTESPDAELASLEKGPFEHTAELQANRMLERFLDTLDEDKRVAFALADLEGLTVPEICQLTGANHNTVYSRLRAARAQLAHFLASQGDADG
jgi:RNA polymerase sigma-70 factor, ECF subfamily